MEFVDRTAKNPNRYKITYEDGSSSSYAKIELADNPINVGTPLNRDTFNKMQNEQRDTFNKMQNELNAYDKTQNELRDTFNEMQNELRDNFNEMQNELNAYDKTQNELRDTFNKMQDKLNAYVEGNVLITSTNRNPKEYLGGTWELIEKGFKNNSSSVMFDKYVGDESYYGAENYKSRYSIHYFDKMKVNCFRSHSAVRLRIEFYLKKGATFNDEGVSKAALLDFSDFGFTNLPVSYNYIPCYTDALSAKGLLMNILADGTVRIDDILVDNHTSNSTLVVPSHHEDALNIDITTPIRIEHMMDDFCDKFYWKRIK